MVIHQGDQNTEWTVLVYILTVFLIFLKYFDNKKYDYKIFCFKKRDWIFETLRDYAQKKILRKKKFKDDFYSFRIRFHFWTKRFDQWTTVMWILIYQINFSGLII